MIEMFQLLRCNIFCDFLKFFKNYSNLFSTHIQKCILYFVLSLKWHCQLVVNHGHKVGHKGQVYRNKIYFGNFLTSTVEINSPVSDARDYERMCVKAL